MLPETSRAAIATDCRVYERTICAVPSTCQPVSVSESKEMRWPASIRNISQGGVLIALERRFEKGSALALELPGDLARESAIVFVQVIHLRRTRDGWALGCKFISPLGDDELQRLLTSTHHVLSTEQDFDDREDEA